MTASPATGGSLEIRPPLQNRSKQAWQRVLDAGVTLVEDGGYEAFTIAAVCERSQVPPRALYARVDNKDALFLAVYEHGIARVRAEHAAFGDEARWRPLTADQVVSASIRLLADIFTRHAAFLRSVVLISGAHPEVHRRGARYSRDLGDRFTALLLSRGAGATEPDPEAAVRAAFNAVFSALVVRTAYGRSLATPADSDEDFLTTLTAMVNRYLLPT